MVTHEDLNPQTQNFKPSCATKQTVSPESIAQ